MKLFKTLAVSAAVALASTSGVVNAGTLEDVIARGELNCVVTTGVPGFAAPDDSGRWAGFDVDFCRATADDFNFSTNPTFTDTSGRIKVIGSGQENVEKSFAFITTVGLYDSSEELLAVAKLSRPVEKNDEKDLTFRVRLDF